MKKVFAVSLNFKTYEDLNRCITCLEKSLLKNYSLRIIVVDTVYDKLKQKKLQKKHPNIILLKNKNNLGVGKGFNLGFKLALQKGADYIFMITPDIFVKKDSLLKLIQKAETNPHIGMVTPKILLDTIPPQIYFVVGKLDSRVKTSDHVGYGDKNINAYDLVEDTDFVNCAAVLVKAELFKKIGFLDPKYFLYYEDIDWSLRAKRGGFGLYVVKNAIVLHRESSTIGKGSNMQEYYITRNHLLFVWKNFNFFEFLIAFSYVTKESVVLLIQLIHHPGRQREFYKLLGLVDFLKGRFGYREI